MSRPQATCRLAMAAMVVALALTGPTHAAAQASACSETTCDFQSSKTVIRADLYRVECDKLAVDKLDRRYYGPPGIRAPANFVRGVCLFERIARGLKPLNTQAEGGLSASESAIGALQQAQSTALLASQRTTAALFEGMLHCGELDTLDKKGAAAGSARRCQHRAMAKASFARVDMSGLSLSYLPDGGRFDQIIEGMITCQEKHLHVREAAACGTLVTASADQLKQVVDVAADAVLPQYFGEDVQTKDGNKAVAPVTAMLARKVSEATAATEGSQAAFARLSAKRDELVKTYQALASKLCGARRMVDPQAPCAFSGMGNLVSAYEAAVEEVTKYTTFVEQAVEGLFRDDTSPDVRRKLAENLKAANEAVALLAPKQAALTSLASDLTRLAVDPQGTETVRRACKILYCDMHASRLVRLDTACRSVDQTSSQPLSLSNSLCDATGARAILPSSSATAVSLCREAGFERAPSSCE